MGNKLVGGKSKQDIFNDLIKSGDLGTIKKLFKTKDAESIRVNSPDLVGMTPLMIASQYGHTEVICWLLCNKSADGGINLRGNLTGRAALHYASERGDSEAVTLLLAVPGVDVNLRDLNGCTALHCAVLATHCNAGERRGSFVLAVTTLINVGKADCTVRDNEGMTALDLARRSDKTDLVPFLQKKFDEQDMVKDPRKFSELQAQRSKEEAARKREAEELKVQRQKAFMAHLREYKFEDMKKVFSQGGVDVNWRDPCPSLLCESHRYALHFVANLPRGHRPVSILNWLLSVGVGVNIKNKYGRNALFEVYELETLMALVEAGADTDVKDNFGWTVLDYEYGKLRNNRIEYLESCGASYSDVSRFVYLARQGKLADMQEIYLGFDVAAQDSSELTALHGAVLGRHFDVFEWLITLGAAKGIHLQDVDCWTPLYYACSENNVDDAESLSSQLRMVRLLLRHGAVEGINIICDSSTVLHEATSNDNLQLVKILVEEGGADITILDNEGRTALDFAKSEGFVDIVAFLESRDPELIAQRQKAFNAYALKCNLTAMKRVFKKGGVYVLGDGYDALRNAVCPGDGHLNCVKWLLCNGAAKAVNIVSGEYERTLLHWARNIDVVRALVEAGADMTVTDSRGMTALDCKYLDLEFSRNDRSGDVIAYLESLGAPYSFAYKFIYLAMNGRLTDLKKMHEENREDFDVAAQDYCGDTALHLAYDHFEVCQWLISVGATKGINLQDRDEFTPLLMAVNNMSCSSDYELGKLQQLVRLYLRNGAAEGINIKGEDGRTVLHDCPKNCLALVKILVEEGGADVTIEDANGKTALDYARDSDEQETVAYLESRDPERLRQEAEVKAAAERAVAEAARRQEEQFALLEATVSACNAISRPCSMLYSDLIKWTKNFSATNVLGEGAYGVVYRGLAKSPDGRRGVRVAVKRIRVDLAAASDRRALAAGAGAGAGGGGDGDGDGGGDQAMSSFLREINVLSRFRHPNIVKLVGYSEPSTDRNESPCLVYELLPLGGLNKILLDDEKAHLLPWVQRLEILFQISTAVNYLHRHNPGHPAYHRDLKAANVALTAGYTAKLIDCGMSKYVDDDDPAAGVSIHTATGFRFGTVGYMCPAYCKGKAFDPKCEIYSFGILLLEVLTGSLQNSKDPSTGERCLLEEAIGDIPADPRAGDWPVDCSAALFKLAEQCTADYKKRIKDMSTVMRTLKDINDQFCKLTQLDSVFHDRLEALVSENAALSLAKDVSSFDRMQCSVCYELESGILCSNTDVAEQHFICRACLSSMMSSQCNDFGAFTSHDRHIVCCFCSAAYPETAVCGACDNAALNAYIAAKEAAVRAQEESKAAGQREVDRARHQDEMMALEARFISDLEEKRAKNVQRHRLRIVSEILETRCPHCQLVS